MKCKDHNQYDMEYIYKSTDEKLFLFCKECISNDNILQKQERFGLIVKLSSFFKNESKSFSEIFKEIDKKSELVDDEILSLSKNIMNESIKLNEDFSKLYINFKNLYDTAKNYLIEQIGKQNKNIINEIAQNKKNIDNIKNTWGNKNIFSRNDFDTDKEFIFALLKRNKEFYKIDNKLFEIITNIMDIEKNEILCYKNDQSSFEFVEFLSNLLNKFLQIFFRKFKKVLKKKNKEELNIDELKIDFTNNLNKIFSELKLNTTNNLYMDQNTNINDTTLNNISFSDINNFEMPRYIVDCNNKLGKLKINENIKIEHPNKNELRSLNNYIKYNNNEIYIGQIYDNKKNGYGKLLYPDGKSYYEGYFLNNLPHYFGRFISDDNEVYEGDMFEGHSKGVGVFITKNNDKYIGNWENSFKNGIGEEFYKDGSYFKGNFLNNKKFGLGQFTKFNKENYVGNFLDDKFSGKGKYTWSENEYYDGEWYNNKKHGKGSYKYSNGGIYTGDFSNDLPNGMGELRKKDKLLFKGFWKDGKPVGYGYKDINHETSIVSFVNGKIKN